MLATLNPINRKTSEFAMKAANSQTATTKARPSGEIIFRFGSLSTPKLPIKSPAATVASTPEKWKYSASKNEP